MGKRFPRVKSRILPSEDPSSVELPALLDIPRSEDIGETYAPPVENSGVPTEEDIRGALERGEISEGEANYFIRRIREIPRSE